MLVLRRKPEEGIVLNGEIKVYVLAVEGERVKLGISAPPDVVIVREELLGDGQQRVLQGFRQRLATQSRRLPGGDEAGEPTQAS